MRKWDENGKIVHWDENGKIVHWMEIGILILTMVVSATMFVSSRPTRDEVDDMIDKRTSQRFDRVEKQLDDMQKDIKEILRSSK